VKIVHPQSRRFPSAALLYTRWSERLRDLFISYCHRDNVGLTQEQIGWVDRFHHALKVRVTQLLGRESDVFFDSTVMSGINALTPTIRHEIGNAKVLVSIMSPGYLASDWCNEELDQFALAAGPGGLVLSTASRIVKVLKLPVDPEREKQAKVDLSDVLGYPFYRVNVNGAPSEFDPEDPPSRREFVKRVNELAYDVHKVLGLVAAEQPSRAEVVPPSGKTVYVAETTSDLADDAMRLRRALVQRGHTVLPRAPFSYGPAYAGAVRDDIERSDLSVHLIGASYGMIPEQQATSIVELQLDVAAEESLKRSGFRRLAWSPPNLALGEERQKQFVAKLDAAAQRVVMSYEAFVETVRAALEPVLSEPAAAPDRPVAVAEPPSIYLIYDEVDRDAARALDDALYERGCNVLQPIFDGDEARRRKHDERCLVECDAVLLFAADAPADWLVQRELDLRRAPAYGRTSDFAARGVALGPPRNVDKDRFRRQGMQKLALYDGVSSDALAPFFAELDTRRPSPI
jgi:hypothetical protein